MRKLNLLISNFAFRQAVQNATQDVNEFDNMTVYIAQDCTGNY